MHKGNTSNFLVALKMYFGDHGAEYDSLLSLDVLATKIIEISNLEIVPSATSATSAFPPT